MRWEYLVVELPEVTEWDEAGNFNFNPQQATLNKLGKDGWELVAIIPLDSPLYEQGHDRAFLKREKA